ncbi:MAG: CDP-glucose 4,6-dehydratase [Legionellaceae bacterium]|nr:CDP-glucose 4,6-dehydratase [Legionellaceae bacterium]
MGSITNMHDVFTTLRGKRVFITGHTGFKGSWLTFLLKEIGCEVMGYALPPESKPSHFELLQLEHHIAHISGDVRDFDALNNAMQSFQPEYVFHLAAQALVKKSYQDPLLTVGSNVLGSANLLEAVRQCDAVRSLVYITSDKCYENVEWVWGYRENDRLGGHDPYSASKAAAELIFSAYVHSYFNARTDLGAASTRAGNVIGGGDWAADRIIPDCIRAIEQEGIIQLRNPTATRPWQHVLEPLSGYLVLAAELREQPEKYAGAWNFGPSTYEVRTVHEVATTITQHLGRGKVEVEASGEHPHEAQLLQLNCDKAHQLLNWNPRWDVSQTLAATSQWYKSVMEGENAMEVTLRQLHEYFPELA